MTQWLSHRQKKCPSKGGHISRAAHLRFLHMGYIVSHHGGRLHTTRRLADNDTTVLFRGETGTGKDVLALWLHALGKRRERPFIRVNCCALPDSLVEAELFGFTKGSFPGGQKRRIGIFEYAADGTLFLDEIGDATQKAQAVLLHAMAHRQITRLGSSKLIPVRARVLAATNRDLEAAISTGAFRDDLLYLLASVQITVPPLRARKEDILPFAKAFVHQCSEKFNRPSRELHPDAVDLLLNYPWPGNIRELENAIERAMILGDTADCITPKELAGLSYRWHADDSLPDTATASSGPGDKQAIVRGVVWDVFISHASEDKRASSERLRTSCRSGDSKCGTMNSV